MELKVNGISRRDEELVEVLLDFVAANFFYITGCLFCPVNFVLTFWTWNYFFLILAHPVNKM